MKKKQAEGYHQEDNVTDLFDDQFNMTDTLLTILITMPGINFFNAREMAFVFFKYCDYYAE
ncbi:MAG: hypothetical protein ABJA37_11085 [Ferruginibacter sp.]